MTDFSLLLSQLSFTDAIDILLVTVVFYGILRLFAGTQGVQLLRGVLVLVLIGVLASNFTGLVAFSWLIRNSGLAVLVAIPVIFQPELRRLLERLGRTALYPAPFLFRPIRPTGASRLISEVVGACTSMSQLRYGAIIILEGQTGLQEVIETGVAIYAQVSQELLLTVFYPGTTLHDGAVIIQNELLAAAGCVLPLTARPLADASMGTRHRAGIGISEVSDALAVIVSEENGTISAARNGRLVRRLDDKRLRRILEEFFEARTMTTHFDEESAAT